MNPVIEPARRARARSVSWLLWVLFWLLANSFAFLGCNRVPRDIVGAQTPGAASGAGATLTGPANAATPTTQTAERITVYAPPAAAPASAPVAAAVASPGVSLPSAAAPGAPGAVVTLAAPPPLPAWIAERTTTTLGAHQDAAGIIGAAAALGSWSWLRWVGVACILAGVAGWLWSVGNPHGFPLVFLGIAGCGVVFLFAASHPAWLLLLVLPFGFYGVQKLGLLRPLA